MMWRHCDQLATSPRQFICQLSPELEPSLVEYRLVQAGLGTHMLARGCASSRRRLRHIAYPQLFHHYDRVVKKLIYWVAGLTVANLLAIIGWALKAVGLF